MGIFFKMAWRNIQRNIRRTLITLGAISFGLTAIILFFGFIHGFHVQWIESALKLQSGHVIINAEGYFDDPKISNYIEEPGPAIERLSREPGVTVFAPRVEVYGLVSTAENSVGVLIRGIDLERERDITSIKKRVYEGSFLGASGGILLGHRLAKKLNAEIGDKIVLMIQAADGSIGADLFRLAGTFRMGSVDLDSSLALISIKDAQELAVIADGITEIAVLVEDPRNVTPIVERLDKDLALMGYEVKSWEEVLGAIKELIELDYIFMYFLLAIVLVVVSLGILNTMLMSIIERTREFGIMMALGTKPLQVVKLVLLESLVIAVIGTTAGAVFGITLNEVLSFTGVDMSKWAEGFELFMAIEPVVYPENDFPSVIFSSIIIFLTTIVVSIYPALKAARLKPVEAIHFV